MQKEVPILFQTEMVEAILAGRKTMTRRLNTKIQPGDSIWVRETWTETCDEYGTPIIGFKSGGAAYFIGPGNELLMPCKSTWSIDNFPSCGKWKPSLFMRKKSCRIWLKCTDRREEHLHDISDEDAIAEGILSYKDEILGMRYKDYMVSAKYYGHPHVDYPSVSTPVGSFQSLWEKINGIESFVENPMLSVIKFEVLSTTGRPKNELFG